MQEIDSCLVLVSGFDADCISIVTIDDELPKKFEINFTLQVYRKIVHLKRLGVDKMILAYSTGEFDILQLSKTKELIYVNGARSNEHEG